MRFPKEDSKKSVTITITDFFSKTLCLSIYALSCKN